MSPPATAAISPPSPPLIRPWDNAAPPPPIRLPPATAANPRIIGIPGAIGIEKGYDLLLACARDASDRRLPLRLVVLGHTTDDAQLLATGSVFITGEYSPPELPRLIAAERIERAFLPSIWPETWSYTLSEMWRAGLHVVALDIGTQAERIRTRGGGQLLPLSLPAGRGQRGSHHGMREDGKQCFFVKKHQKTFFSNAVASVAEMRD